MKGVVRHSYADPSQFAALSRAIDFNELGMGLMRSGTPSGVTGWVGAYFCALQQNLQRLLCSVLICTKYCCPWKPQIAVSCPVNLSESV